MYNAIFLLLGITTATISCFNIDSKNVQTFSGDQGNNYFGYSILLQYKRNSTDQANIFVGAPKANSSAMSGVFQPGVLYKCAVKRLRCFEHKISMPKNEQEEFGRSLLGASVDGGPEIGDPLVVCQPKLINIHESDYHTRGLCYYYRNSTLFGQTRVVNITGSWRKAYVDHEKLRLQTNGEDYYSLAFAEIGFSTKYVQEKNKLLVGAPGADRWSGSVIESDVSNSKNITSGFETQSTVTYGHSYLGYSITSGKFTKDVNNIWYVYGAPRASNLLGEVTLKDPQNKKVVQVLKGERIGGYYGSSLLAMDTNNDGLDDLFVAAPMYAEKFYDEGCVYYYRNSGGVFRNTPVKLFGSSKAGSRFGTALADLGDINHDKYRDLAISAPYEEETGVLYIFLGNEAGTNPKYSQIIKPRDFHPKPGRSPGGFGFSTSRATDVDGNGYNDIAIGAYVSGQVFLLRSLPVITYKATLSSSIKTLLPEKSTNFTVKYCVRYVSDVNDLKPVKTNLQLEAIDPRLSPINASFTKAVASTNTCRNISMHFSASYAKFKNARKDYYSPLEPVTLVLIYKQVEFCPNCPRSNPLADGRKELRIPLAHGCATDEVCRTDLQLSAKFRNLTEVFVAGLLKIITIDITVISTKEPAYFCQLHVQLPQSVQLETLPKQCTSEGSHLQCDMANVLVKRDNRSLTLRLDMRKLDAKVKELAIPMNVTSIGEDTNISDNMVVAKLMVDYQSDLHINGKSVPDQASYVTEKSILKENLTLSHKYSLTNFGPSPYQVKLIFLVPLRIGKTNIVDVLLNADRNQLSCTTTVIKSTTSLNYSTFEGTLNSDRSFPLVCGGPVTECLEVKCSGGVLQNSTQTANADIKVNVKTKTIVKLLGQSMADKDMIEFISSGAAIHKEKRKSFNTHTLLFGELTARKIPLWIIIASTSGAFLFLIVIILVLWKAHFFVRKEKEKLQNEKALLQTASYTKVDHLQKE